MIDELKDNFDNILSCIKVLSNKHASIDAHPLYSDYMVLNVLINGVNHFIKFNKTELDKVGKYDLELEGVSKTELQYKVVENSNEKDIDLRSFLYDKIMSMLKNGYSNIISNMVSNKRFGIISKEDTNHLVVIYKRVSYYKDIIISQALEIKTGENKLIYDIFRGLIIDTKNTSNDPYIRDIYLIAFILEEVLESIS